MSKQLAKAISITSSVFKDKTDRCGVPYIIHCLHVMNEVPEESELKQIAVLHDVIEDTEMTFDDLYDAGFSERVVSAIKLLTHVPEMGYDEYIYRIAYSKDATLVKMADLRHNSDIHRMSGLREKDFVRLEKYHRAYAHLKKWLEVTY